MSSIRALTAATAFVLASQAGAAGLIDDNRAVIRYSGEFSSSLATAAKNDGARLHAGGFMTQLESTLKNRADKPLFVDYPKPVSANMLRTIAVVAPQGMEQADIPVCAEQNNKVVGLWNIAANGAVVPVTNWAGPVVSPTPTSSACGDFIRAARSDIAAKYAAMQQQQPPSAQTTPPPKP